jgi:hypothetical protein
MTPSDSLKLWLKPVNQHLDLLNISRTRYAQVDFFAFCPEADVLLLVELVYELPDASAARLGRSLPWPRHSRTKAHTSVASAVVHLRCLLW